MRDFAFLGAALLTIYEIWRSQGHQKTRQKPGRRLGRISSDCTTVAYVIGSLAEGIYGHLAVADLHSKY